MAYIYKSGKKYGGAGGAGASADDMTAQEIEAFVDDINAEGAPSEYKKLLWTNPNPTATFAGQTIAIDLSDYDEVSIVVAMYSANSIQYTETYDGKVGEHLIISDFFLANNSGITRLCDIASSGVTFTAGYAGEAVNNDACIPLRIYGIKYERVAPPRVNASDYVVEQGIDGIWTYRKWNSGEVELWGQLIGDVPQGWSGTGIVAQFPFQLISLTSWSVVQNNYQIARCYLTPSTSQISVQTYSDSALTNILFVVECKGRWK